MNRKPRLPESVCFGKVAMASVVANLPATHLTVMFYLKFLKAVSAFEARNCSGENSTLVYLYLKSSASLFTTYFFFFKSTSYLLCFREASESRPIHGVPE